MWLSSTAQTALRAVLHVASGGHGAPVRAGEIADAVGAPRNYLSKTLHVLTRAGVLVSKRGPNGGFALAVPATEVSLERAIAPFAPADDRRWLLGRRGCGTTSHCMVHAHWSKVATEVERFLATTTVADLITTDISPDQLLPTFIAEDLSHARAAR